MSFNQDRSITSFKRGVSPNVGKSQVNFYPPPDISRPDILYQRVNNGRTDLKYRLNANEVHHSAKALFTIRNLGQNNTALTTGVQKTAISSSNQQQAIANSSREREIEMGISLQSSTTGSIPTESMENGKDEVTEVPIELPYAPQKPLVSSGNNELQQQHTSSTSSTVFLTSIVSTSTQHQVLVSSYPMETKQSEAEEYEPPNFSITYEEQPYFTTSNAIIIHNPSSNEQQFQAENTTSVTTPTIIQEVSVSQRTVLLPNITSERMPSNLINKALSSETTENQEKSSFFETQETLESRYGSDMMLGTSAHINESYTDVSIDTVSSLTVEPDIAVNVPTATTELRGSSVQYSGDNYETNILEDTKNSSGTIDRNNSLQTERILIRPIDVVSSYDKQLVKPRIQSLLPFHFSMKNGTIVSNNVPSNRQMSLKQETISKSFTHHKSDTDKSNVSSTLVVITHKQTFTPATVTSEQWPGLRSNHSLSAEEIPNITNEKETLGNFGQEADDLQGTSNSKQQSSFNGGYYPEEQHSFADLNTKGSSSDTAETDEQNSQTNDIHLTNFYPSYENEEMIERGKIPVQLGHTDIIEDEQINKMKTSSDLHPSSIDASGITNGTTHQSIMVIEMESETFKEIHEIKQTVSSSPSDETSFNISSQLIPSNETVSLNKDTKELMPSVFPQMTNRLPPTFTVTPASILAGIHRTEMPVKETTHDNHVTSLNWYSGESSQRVSLPVSKLEVSDTSSLTSETNTITTQKPSRTINISASTSPAIMLIPSSVPLSTATEFSSAVAAAQHERTAIDHSAVEESSKVHPFHGGPSEGLVGTVSSYPKGVLENDWSSQFKTEVSPSEILHSDPLSGTAEQQIKKTGTSSYANNVGGHEDGGNYDNVMAIVSVIRN
uniref:Protein kinase domain-containing protein n=1 Tax=Loa loa TaxID=7209 RepID=A0A1I7VF21_LOALO